MSLGLPDKWTEVTVGDIATVSSGTTPSRGEPTFWNGTIPWITTGEINYKDLWDSEEKVTQLALRKTALRLFPKDGLIMAMYGQGATRGRVARLKIDATTNQACAYIKPLEFADCEFIYQYFSHNYENLREMGHGGNQKNLSGQLVKQFPVLLPPLPEQRRIAAILSQWDDSLSILAKLIEAKRQQKRGLAEQLLTGKRRLKGFEGEWQEKALSAFLQESRVPGSDGAKARKITVKLWGKGVYEKQEKLLGSENTKYFRRRAGQLIYSKLDFLNGAFGIIPEELDGLESTLDLPCFDFLNGLDPNFVLEYISRADFYSRFESGAIGGRIARRVTPDEFLKTQVLLPPLPEQRAISSILSTLDEEITTLGALKTKVQEQKRGLMDLLLTGKVRVKVDGLSMAT